MDLENREVDAGRPCPLCGGRLLQQESRVQLAEPGVVTEWQPGGHRCPRGCYLTAQDLADG